MFVSYKETTLDSLGSGVTRRVLAHGGSAIAVEVSSEQGVIGPMHSHPYEQLTYASPGGFEFTTSEKEHIVRVGDTLYKQSSIMHGYVCLKPGTLLDTFTPICEDFLYR